MQAIFKQNGITVLTSSIVNESVAGDEGVTVKIKSGEKVLTEKYEVVIVSIGRQPATCDIGLEKADIKPNDKGFIPVNGRMMTEAKNIFAAGDVVPGPMLAHAAFAEGEVAAEAAAGHDTEPVDYECIPAAVFTDVQAASVGMTEEEARSRGLDVSVGKHFYKASGKAVIDDRTEGFVKVIADNSTRRFLGVHVIGENASELIHEFTVAKKAGLTVNEVAGTVHAHPTLSETAADACKAVFGKAIHG
jgi:dihydrolipoamide dehydrogenase